MYIHYLMTSRKHIQIVVDIVVAVTFQSVIHLKYMNIVFIFKIYF